MSSKCSAHMASARGEKDTRKAWGAVMPSMLGTSLWDKARSHPPHTPSKDQCRSPNKGLQRGLAKVWAFCPALHPLPQRNNMKISRGSC